MIHLYKSRCAWLFFEASLIGFHQYVLPDIKYVIVVNNVYIHATGPLNVISLIFNKAAVNRSRWRVFHIFYRSGYQAYMLLVPCCEY